MKALPQTHAIRNALEPSLFAELSELVLSCDSEVKVTGYCGPPGTITGRGWNHTPRCLAERVGIAVWYAASVNPAWEPGFEWWLRVANTTDAHHWHLDKDEALWDKPKGERELRTPLYSSVLYLSYEGGPTIVTNQEAVLSDDGQEILRFEPAEEDAWIVGEQPEPNKLLIFPGHLQHGVGTSDKPGLRHTLIYNWWDRRPLNMPDEPTLLPGETP